MTVTTIKQVDLKGFTLGDEINGDPLLPVMDPSSETLFTVTGVDGDTPGVTRYIFRATYFGVFLFFVAAIRNDDTGEVQWQEIAL